MMNNGYFIWGGLREIIMDPLNKFKYQKLF